METNEEDAAKVGSPDNVKKDDKKEDTRAVQAVVPAFRSMQMGVPEPLILLKNTDSVVGKPNPYTREDVEMELEYEKDSSLNPFTLPNPETRIKRVGLFHQISNNSIEVGKEFTGIVLNELVECFRLNSFEVKYESTPTVFARCRVIEQLEFVVFVWASRNDENRILIEVDRVAGESILFHSRYSKLILQTVESSTKSVKSSSEQQGPVSDPIARWSSNEDMAESEAVSCLINLAREQIKQDTNKSFLDVDPVDSVLETVKEQVSSKKYHLFEIGLETLLQLTDPSVSGIETSRDVSAVVLTGKRLRHETDFSVIRENVLCLAVTGLYGNNAAYTHEDLARQAFTALAVIAQAFNHVGATESASFISCGSSALPQGVTIVDGLLHKISEANNSPHVAYLAIHILAVLCRNAIPEAREKIRKELHLVRKARWIGSKNHAALELASGRLLHIIGGKVMG